jgi:hypothetical protein
MKNRQESKSLDNSWFEGLVGQDWRRKKASNNRREECFLCLHCSKMKLKGS